MPAITRKQINEWYNVVRFKHPSLHDPLFVVKLFCSKRLAQGKIPHMRKQSGATIFEAEPSSIPKLVSDAINLSPFESSDMNSSGFSDALDMACSISPTLLIVVSSEILL
jgi:hypothetical protein